MKKLMNILSVFLLLYGCTTTLEVNQPNNPIPENGETTTDAETGLTIDTETGLLQMTIDELVQFNGKDGNKAYVAIDGNVYDVTNNRKWLNGDHERGMSAGRDLSAYISSAPHGYDILKQFTIVGKIVE